jgi:hypothetical protein
MACEYCRSAEWYLNEYPKELMSLDEKMSLKGDFYPGIRLVIDGATLHAQAIADVYEPSYMEKEIKINFCPVCGRMLKE